MTAPNPLPSWDSVAHTVEFTVPLNWSAFREKVATDAEILEIGCGYGRVAAELVAIGYKNVRGYDASQKMIKRANALHPEIRLSVADASALPEPDHSCDVVVLSALLTCVPAPARQREVIKEIARVLRPTGAVHGVEFLRQERTAYPDGGLFNSRYGITMWHFEPQELRGLFADFGGWQAGQLKVPSLSGTPADILQFVALRAPPPASTPD
jgi:ubiquinone/menaquinone biosynthesis C-methylase UbiE